MKLTYRGVEYNQENQNFSTSTAAVQNRKIIYRGNSSQAEINPRFPWWQYIKQLFVKAESQPVFDPITFWYDHRKKFIKDFWCFVTLNWLFLNHAGILY